MLNNWKKKLIFSLISHFLIDFFFTIACIFRVNLIVLWSLFSLNFPSLENIRYGRRQ